MLSAHLPRESSAEMMILGQNRHHLIIVENEFDAMLIHQEAGDIVTAIALYSAQARPDALSNDILTKAKQILKALDIGTTEKKKKAGYREWLWWKKYFKQSRRWPTLKGKDPGESYKNGVSIRDWVMAGGAQKDHHRRKEDAADTPSNNSEIR